MSGNKDIDMALAKNKALNVPVTLLIGSTSYEVSMKSIL